VAYWIQEFHLDGLRIDATQQIFDSSDEHILAAITRKVRETAHPRSTLIVGENEPQKAVHLLPYDKGGYAIDAVWNDDFHHSAMVAMTGRADAYYTDYRGTPQEFVFLAEMGVSVPRTVVRLAGATTRYADAGPTPVEVCQLSPESRSVGQLGKWQTHSAVDESQPVPRAHSRLSSGSADSYAFSGSGVCRVEPLLLFCRP
jgi:hypothetical protein